MADIQLEPGETLIGQGMMACGAGEAGVKAREASLSTFMTSSYRYAYPNKVNGIYENE